MSKIIVVGSSNTDMVVHTSHLPVPGETILGGKFLMNQGGKGANQAVAVKRLGGDLLFVAKLGDDILGQQALRVFQNEGIATNYIALDKETPSGVALIMWTSMRKIVLLWLQELVCHLDKETLTVWRRRC